MSDYHGPSKHCKVRLVKPFPRFSGAEGQVPPGTILNAIIYDVGMNVHIELPDGRKWFQIPPEDVEEVVADKFVPVNRLPLPKNRKEAREQLALVCNTGTERVRVEAFGQVFETRAAFKRFLKTKTAEEIRTWKWALKHTPKTVKA